jgi:hypothetical protein
MKKLYKRINWKKFWKYELIAFLIIDLLYFNSVMAGRNVYPENIYIIFLAPSLFGLMMLIGAHSNTLRERFDKNF